MEESVLKDILQSPKILVLFLVLISHNSIQELVIEGLGQMKAELGKGGGFISAVLTGGKINKEGGVILTESCH